MTPTMIATIGPTSLKSTSLRGRRPSERRRSQVTRRLSESPPREVPTCIVSPLSSCSLTAPTTAGWPCPRMSGPIAMQKSMYSLPSASQIFEPSPLDKVQRMRGPEVAPASRVRVRSSRDHLRSPFVEFPRLACVHSLGIRNITVHSLHWIAACCRRTLASSLDSPTRLTLIITLPARQLGGRDKNKSRRRTAFSQPQRCRLAPCGAPKKAGKGREVGSRLTSSSSLPSWSASLPLPRTLKDAPRLNCLQTNRRSWSNATYARPTDVWCATSACCFPGAPPSGAC